METDCSYKQQVGIRILQLGNILQLKKKRAVVMKNLEQLNAVFVFSVNEHHLCLNLLYFKPISYIWSRDVRF